MYGLRGFGDVAQNKTPGIPGVVWLWIGGALFAAYLLRPWGKGR